MNLWKRMLLGAAACLGMLSFGSGDQRAYASNSTPTPTIYVDGELLHFDTAPVIYHDRTLVPMRMIMEAMGATVTFDKQTNSAVATLNGTTIRMPLGNRNVKVNSKTVMLDVPAMLINYRTMVPVRFLSDTFGNQLEWDGKTCVANITTSHAPQVRVIGADRTVGDGQTSDAKSMIQTQNVVQQVQQEVDLTYKKPIWMYVTNSDDGYRQAMITYGDSDQTDVIAKNSDGVSFGSHVIIPLHKQPSIKEEEMTIAHEMMHVLLNQNGGNWLPSWVHEGLAWETGLDVSLNEDPSIMRTRWEGTIRDDVLTGVSRKQYLPLITDLSDAIDALSQASYNLEYQDYLAYRYLINKFGKNKFNQYVKDYLQDDANAFDNAFGMSQQRFETEFHQYLSDETTKTDSGVQLTLQVPSGFNGTFSILPQGTSVWKHIILAPGTHTIRIFKDGHIEGAVVTNTSDDKEKPEKDTVYLYTELSKPIKDQGVDASGGGLAVYDSFGHYVFSNVWLQTTSDAKFPNSNKFLGVELLDVQAIQ